MKAMNRRNFMKMVAGVTAAVGLTGKAEEPRPKNSTVDLTTVPNYITKKYDLIADLVGEMNKFDKRHPDTDIDYSIHCNYTGLAFLNDTGGLDKNEYIGPLFGIKEGLLFKLWVPYILYKRGKKDFVALIDVMVLLYINADLQLVARTTEKCSLDINAGTHNHIYQYELVTTRCFNVNRDEEGRIIAGLEEGQRFCRAKESVSKGDVVAYTGGIDSESDWAKQTFDTEKCSCPAPYISFVSKKPVQHFRFCDKDF